MRNTLLAFLLCAGAATAAEPDEPWPLTEGELVIAESLLEFLSPETWSYGFTWGSVAVRTGMVNWHLADPADDDHDPVYIRRTGSLSYPGRSHWVTACGDRETPMVATITGGSQVMFGARDSYEEPRIVAALEEKGAHVEEISRGDGFATHRVSLPGRLPGVLDELRVCSPEGAAHAPQCETRYTLVLDASNLDAAEELRGRCATPGIWW